MRLCRVLRRRVIRREESGFTLAELLIAIVISAVIIGPITGAIIVGLRTTGAASTRLSQTRDIELVQGVLPRDMFSAAQVYVKGQTNAQAANTCAGKPGGQAAGSNSLVVMTWFTTSLISGDIPPQTTPPQNYEVDYVYALNPLVPPSPQTGSLTRYLYKTGSGSCILQTTSVLATSLSKSSALQTAAVTNNATTGSTLTLTLTDSTCAKFAASAQERSPATTTTTTTTTTAPPACTG